MRYGSVCSGIEAATVAWDPLGWAPAWFSEIEPFPSAVLTHRYPGVPNLGDMTTLWPRVLTGEIEAPDVLVGGTPCQAFSVAGLRRSLEDARGNLALSFVELAAAVDAVRIQRQQPHAFILWENVPGVLSVKDNAFGCLLGGLVGADAPVLPPGGRWARAGVVAGPARVAAWRVLDAQHFGVAQRRRRVFVLARGGPRAWAAADALLPLVEGVRRHPPPRREAGEGAPAGAPGGAGVSVDLQNTRLGGDVAGTLDTTAPSRGGGQAVMVSSAGERARALTASGGTRCDLDTETFVADVAPTINARPPGYDADTVETLVTLPIPFDETQVTSRENRSRCDPGSPALARGARPPTIAYALRSDAGREGRAKTPSADAEGRVRLRDPGFTVEVDRAPTLDASAPTLDASAPHSVCAPLAFHATQDPISGEVAPALGCGSKAGSASRGTLTASRVRRLTPRECERLQGFPDDYTLIPWKKGEAPDGPRYRALGNSMAVPVMRHIGRAIQRMEDPS